MRRRGRGGYAAVSGGGVSLSLFVCVLVGTFLAQFV